MVYKEHYIELFVNGRMLELESQESVNIRFNNVLLDPTKITSTQAEYSFSFDIPCTPENNKTFDYANNLAKENKFHQRYNAELYADGSLIFEGSLTLNGVKGNKYNVNLVSVKVYSLEDIFGDKTMDKIRPFSRASNGTIEKNDDGTFKHKNWEIEFNGVSTINNMNQSRNPDAIFPTVAYGVFQKSPSATTDVGNEYTSKFDMDEWNRWYVESFPPSHNMLQTLKYAFETGDYITDGDVFTNPELQYIYMSDNYADGQDPEYNVGNDRFGLVSASLQAYQSGSTWYEQELKFPYFQVNCVGQGFDSITSQTEYNFNAVRIYDLLGSGSTVTVNNTPNYMYQPNEGIIIIPADGFYKIEMRANATLISTGDITAKQWLVNMIDREMSDDTDITMPVGLDEVTPIEIALIRNYDDDYELIKGKNNRQYIDGNPTHEYYEISGQRRNNIREWLSCFPHEDLYNSRIPTEDNDLLVKMPRNGMGGKRTTSDTSNLVKDENGNWTSGNDITSPSGNFSGWRGGTRGGDSTAPIGGASTSRVYRIQDLGYVYRDGDNMCFDQAVSENFICGLSSMSGGVSAVMKNGYSWSKVNSSKNEIFNTELGYLKMKSTADGGIEYEDSKLNFNTYINTPNNYCRVNGNTMNGYVSCMAYLKKNDVLRLVAVHRAYDAAGSLTAVNYDTSISLGFTIRAFSPRSYNKIKASKDNEYYRSTEFPDKLNLANFFNKETKISDWVQNIIDAFNLEVVQNGNHVTINTKNKEQSTLLSAVGIDDRTNSSEAESSAIEYPKSMAVKWKIDEDEWGFERSAVAAAGGDETILDQDDWQKYADSGYTPIQLNDDSWVTATSDKNLQFSYCWYDNFNFYQCNNQYQRTSNDPVTLKIPVISKFSYMIDGYSYDESMKHDGFALSQRFWFKNTPLSQTVWTRTYPPESVKICLPKGQFSSSQYGSFYMSYKSNEPSLLQKFFNPKAYLSSNLVNVEVYLSADEYNRIKNGSYVQFDSDLYIPVNIDGYDPSGVNPTTLQLMKKVV